MITKELKPGTANHRETALSILLRCGVCTACATDYLSLNANRAQVLRAWQTIFTMPVSRAVKLSYSAYKTH